MRPLKVMLVDAAAKGPALARALVDAQHELIGRMSSTRDLQGQVRALQPDLIIIDTDSPDDDTLQDLDALRRDQPRPVVIFTLDSDGEKIQAATRAGVSAYVVDGMSPDRVGPIIDAAMARFAQFQALKRELGEAEEKLADRKLIERAKGILMKTRDLSEDDAYRALRSQAMRQNVRLADIARQVIALAGLLA